MDKEKVDLRQDYKLLFSASQNDVNFVGIPPFNFLMIDGKGNLKSKDFKESIKALNAVAFMLKNMCKNSPTLPDFMITPFESLWWSESGNAYELHNKETLNRTLMLMLPEHITEELFNKAKQTVIAKNEVKLVENLRFEFFDEGASAQVINIGAYSEANPIIQTLYQVINDAGFEVKGKHHEIYLTDPVRTAPEKLKTIVRLPIAKKAKVKVVKS